MTPNRIFSGLRTEGGVSGVRDYLSSFVRPLLSATDKKISVPLNNQKVRFKQSEVLLSFQGAFTAAFEPSNLRRLIGNAASCFDHMKLGTFERDFVFLEHGKDIIASAPHATRARAGGEAGQ
jgi:hypothetical protein